MRHGILALGRSSQMFMLSFLEFSTLLHLSGLSLKNKNKKD
jgi:hypothetical protein